MPAARTAAPLIPLATLVLSGFAGFGGPGVVHLHGGAGAAPRFPSAKPMTVIAVVRDATDGHPVQGITVTNLLTSDTVVTDQDGEAVFPKHAYPSEGMLRLALEGPGYVPRLFAQRLPRAVAGRDGEVAPWTTSVALDPADRVLTTTIGAEGADLSTTLHTGIVHAGEEYLQSVQLTVPPGAWQGEYRLGLSPISNAGFDYVDFDVPAPRVFPVAGFSIRLLDPVTRAPIAGNPVAEPIAITLDPAYVKDFADRPAPVRTWRVDLAARAFSSEGVVATELVRGRLHVVVDRPGIYQVFAGDVSLPDVRASQEPESWESSRPFQWIPGSSLTGPDGNALPLVACTTYTYGQAEPIVPIGAPSRRWTYGIEGCLTAETEARLPLSTGAVFLVGIARRTAWATTSEWPKEITLGTRTYHDPPLCGEVCLTVRAGLLAFREVRSSRSATGAMVRLPTGRTNEVLVVGPVCIADDDLAPCE